jgi:hypothetical protein
MTKTGNTNNNCVEMENNWRQMDRLVTGARCLRVDYFKLHNTTLLYIFINVQFMFCVRGSPVDSLVEWFRSIQSQTNKRQCQ